MYYCENKGLPFHHASRELVKRALLYFQAAAAKVTASSGSSARFSLCSIDGVDTMNNFTYWLVLLLICCFATLYHISGSRPSKTKNEAIRKPKVVMTVFAGRRANLEIQFKYVDELLSRGLLTEYHIMDNTKTPEDREFIRSFRKKYQIIPATGYNDYYEHYSKVKANENDVYIKIDDDIVFIDVNMFASFVGNRIANPQFLIASPSIINNPVCAYYQKMLGIIDLDFPSDYSEGKLWTSASLAEELQLQFLACHHEMIEKSANLSFVIHRLSDRFSINLIAFLGKDLPLLKEVLRGEDDEHELTVEVTKRLRRQLYIDMSFVCSHLA